MALISVVTIYYFWQSQATTNSTVIELSPPTHSSLSHSPSSHNLQIESADFEEFNYGEIESALADLRFENEHLVLDANTESQFSIVLEQLPDGYETIGLDRIIFLVQQQFSNNKSQQILSLLKKMSDYKKQETAWWEKNSTANAAGENVDHVNLLFDLQDQVLGSEVAKKLYHEQRRLMQYMAATQAIEKDESLSEKQKQDALEALANTLEQVPSQ